MKPSPLAWMVQHPVWGNTLEVNPLGPIKICSFNCLYCNLGPTEVRLTDLKKKTVDLPPAHLIAEGVRDLFRSQAEQGPGIDAICISGNGEPTLHPDLPALIAALLSFRDELDLKSKFVIYTNGVHLDQKRLVVAVNELDERIVKVDAGSEKLIKQLNSPLVRADVNRLITHSRKLKTPIVHATFVTGVVDNTHPEDLHDWMETIGVIGPRLVQISTPRPPFASGGIQPCREEVLDEIAAKLKRRIGIDVQVISY